MEYSHIHNSRVTGLAYSANRTQLGNLTYAYDADGRRTSKTINGATTQFLGACPPRKRRDGLNPVQELDGAAPPNVTANLLTGLGIDEYFTRTDASGTMAFLADALGSTVGLVNSAGGIDTSYTYQPFGATTVNGTSANPYQFTGRENDGASLYYYRARYYSPTFQRFIAQDPIGFAGGDANLYAYVGNDPLNHVDPRGTESQTGPIQPAPTCSATPTPGGSNTEEIPPPWGGNCCCGPACDNNLPINTPDWEQPLITQLLDQNPGMTTEEAQQIINQEIRDGKITHPGK